MHRAANAIFLPRTEILGDDHRSARGQAHKEAHNQIDQRAGSAADGCQHAADDHKHILYKVYVYAHRSRKLRIFTDNPDAKSKRGAVQQHPQKDHTYHQQVKQRGNISDDALYDRDLRDNRQLPFSKSCHHRRFSFGIPDRLKKHNRDT